jgi:hypothetical protein
MRKFCAKLIAPDVKQVVPDFTNSEFVMVAFMNANVWGFFEIDKAGRRARLIAWSAKAEIRS